MDDNEGAEFDLLVGSLVGPNRLLPRVAWQHSAQGKGYGGGFSLSHNYVFCVQASSDAELGLLARTEEHNVNYSNPDNDAKGPWRPGDVRNALYRPNLIYKLKTPSGNTIDPPPKGWRWSKETMAAKIASGEIIFVDDETRIVRKIYLKDQEGRVPETIWLEKDVGSSRSANAELKALFGSPEVYATPKPSPLVERAVGLSGGHTAWVLDFFAGSGTTGHAVINLNRQDQGERKFLLIDMAEHFDTVLIPRIAKVLFAPEWKDGKPERQANSEEVTYSPRLIRILRLESYEDALSNIDVSAHATELNSREAATKELVGVEQYRLRYLVRLPLEAADTMLDVAKLERPFDYTLEVLTDDGLRQQPVDLIETFHYLLGLRVKKLLTWVNAKDKTKRDKDARVYRVTKATDRDGKKCILVVWRDMTDLNPESDRAFLEARIKQMADAGETWDQMFINGDCAAAGFQSLDGLFKRLMIAGEDQTS